MTHYEAYLDALTSKNNTFCRLIRTTEGLLKTAVFKPAENMISMLKSHNWKNADMIEKTFLKYKENVYDELCTMVKYSNDASADFENVYGICISSVGESSESFLTDLNQEIRYFISQIIAKEESSNNQDTELRKYVDKMKNELEATLTEMGDAIKDNHQSVINLDMNLKFLMAMSGITFDEASPDNNENDSSDETKGEELLSLIENESPVSKVEDLPDDE